MKISQARQNSHNLTEPVEEGELPRPLPTISVCIVCRNEADKLEPCLQSVQWAHEILVMDLCSEDGSAAIAQQYGAQVHSRQPLPIVEPLRNEIAAIASGEWILAMDPDERITPGLAQELQRLAQSEAFDAIVIPRMNIDLGHIPSHPLHRHEPQIRMYRRTRVSWPAVPNKLPTIPAHRLYHLPKQDDFVLIHERNRNIPEAVERIMRYAPAEAQSKIERGEVFSAREMLKTLASKSFIQFYVGKPWNDGVPGLLRAGILIGYHFYVWAAFWHLSGAQRTAADDRLVRRVGFVVEILVQTMLRSARLFRLFQKIWRTLWTLISSASKAKTGSLTGATRE
jgi:glycosyltransferase involved in cell wall biosynthesis